MLIYIYLSPQMPACSAERWLLRVCIPLWQIWRTTLRAHSLGVKQRASFPSIPEGTRYKAGKHCLP